MEGSRQGRQSPVGLWTQQMGSLIELSLKMIRSATPIEWRSRTYSVLLQERGLMLRAWLMLAVLVLASFGAGTQPAGEFRYHVTPQVVTPPPPVFREPPEIDSVGGVATISMLAQISSFGLPSFVWEGGFGVAPTIRVHPGDTIKFRYVNVLPPSSASAMNMSNIHFHGLRVSPQLGSDDVLDMDAAPGQTLDYTVVIPANHEPGLYWYHTHPHGETNLQTGDGAMSGAIVVEGLQTHLPVLASMRERILVIRAPLLAGAIDPDSVRRGRLMRHRMVGFRPITGPGPGPGCNGPDAAHVVTVNSLVQPTIPIGPNEQQFWRVVNATGQRTLDLTIGHRPLILVALDGVALDAFPGSPAMVTVDHIVIPPAGRAEFIVTGGLNQTPVTAQCFFSGPVGDPDPPAVLAYMQPDMRMHRLATVNLARTRVNPLPRNVLSSALPAPAQHRTTVFSENADGTQFFIDGQQFTPGAPPHFIAKLGTVEEWTVQNDTDEIHDFHMHQVHFVVEAVNGVPAGPPYFWYDSFTLPFRTTNPNGTHTPGSITILADFRDPVIKGEFVYHCHLLDHEDKGMMATVLVQ
jgi:suppressor of ftsI